MGRNNKDFGKASGHACVSCGEELSKEPIHSTEHDDLASHHFDKQGNHVYSERHYPTYAGDDFRGNLFSPAGKHCEHCNELAQSAHEGGEKYNDYMEAREEAHAEDTHMDNMWGL